MCQFYTCYDALKIDIYLVIKPVPPLGMDRIVRMWNPYVPGKATGLLRGHSAPIFYLFIAEDDNRIFSISTDKAIKVCRPQPSRAHKFFYNFWKKLNIKIM